MKNPSFILGTLFILFSATLFSQSQVPQGINYQSVARDAAGLTLANRTVSVQFAIHDSTPLGPVIYRENQSVGTNTFGIFSTVIGAGNIIIGHFPGINWGGSSKFLQVLMDFNGGSNFIDMGTSQFMSVPYSLYSNASAGDITNIKYDTSGVLNVNTSNNTFTTTKGGWTTVGNGGMTTNNFIGTINNTDFILKSHGIEAVRYTTGGAILATGNTLTGATPASGPGTRLMWIPAKSAFRAGTVTGTGWDNASIGTNSVAMGTDAIASGIGAVAVGSNNAATGNQASTYGNNLIAPSAGETVLGSYNDTTGSGSPTVWNPSDPLFQIGNGTASTRSNAFTVTKSGNIAAAGAILSQNLTMVPSSIPLTSGTNPVTVGNQGFIIFTSNSLASLTNVTLSNGQRVGQMLIVEVQAAPLNGATIGNGLNLGLSNNSAAMLIWDGTQWAHLN